MKKLKKTGIGLFLLLSLCLTLALGAAAADTAGAEKALLEGLEKQETVIQLEEYGLSQNEAWDLLKQVLEENPRFYYARCAGRIHYEGDTVTSLSVDYLDGIGEAERAAYETAVQEALSCVLPDMSDVQKALVLHDWLILHTAYDSENYALGTIPELSYTAYGAMVLKTAVCDGYARAYADLLTRCGIPCITVSSQQMNHAWNQVCLDGSWYHVDVTWDDPTPDTPGQVYHNNFLKSDAAIQEHYGWSSTHACTDTRYDSGTLWAEQRSTLCFTDADTLWLLRTAGEGGEQTISLTKRSFSTGRETTVASVQDCWKVWGSENQYWLGSFSGLALLDGCLYFNDSLHIYCYDPKTGEQTTVMTISGADYKLYGLFAANGTLYYVASTTPESAGTALRVELKKAEESRPASPFLDIPADSAFFDAAVWALNNNVTTGTGTDQTSGKVIFSPEDTCTRGQVVTFLWRAMGKPEPESLKNPFPDVKETDYYYKAVLWAVEQGITNGINVEGEIHFCPSMTCSYAHILTFLRRCVATAEASDGGTWYAASVAWAQENGLLNGVEISETPDKKECPRKAVVQFLYRCAA